MTDEEKTAFEILMRSFTRTETLYKLKRSEVATNKQRIARLTAKNAELRERLNNAVELPRVECVKTLEWTNRERLGDIMFEWCVIYKNDGWLVVEPCLSKEAAEARLKELEGKERKDD